MYLDTSVIVKLLISEADSEFFQDELSEEFLSSSELALTEVWSALLSKERDKEISASQRAAAWSVLNERVRGRQITLHPLNTLVLKKSNRILEQCHPQVALRTLDAIHTATCDHTQEFPLCTTDRRMRAAAVLLGIPLFPETLPGVR